MGTRARVTTVAGATTLLCAASVFGGGLAAFAASSVVTAPPIPAAVPAPVLVGTCGETVRGYPGQRVGIRELGLSVVDVGAVPAQGSSIFDAPPALHQLAGPLAPLCTITATPLIPVASPLLPMLTAVLDQIKKPLGPVPALLLPSPPAAPSSAAKASQPLPALVPAKAPALPSPALGPFAGPVMPSDFPFALGRYSSGFPHFNYSDLLVTGHPGALGRLSAGMLTADLFGTPQVGNGVEFGTQSAAANDVAAAGRATALPVSGVERVALPVLVAVLMLAGVTAALLRGWALGRR